MADAGVSDSTKVDRSARPMPAFDPTMRVAGSRRCRTDRTRRIGPALEAAHRFRRLNDPTERDLTAGVRGGEAPAVVDADEQVAEVGAERVRDLPVGKSGSHDRRVERGTRVGDAHAVDVPPVASAAEQVDRHLAVGGGPPGVRGQRVGVDRDDSAGVVDVEQDVLVADDQEVLHVRDERPVRVERRDRVVRRPRAQAVPLLDDAVGAQDVDVLPVGGHRRDGGRGGVVGRARAERRVVGDRGALTDEQRLLEGEQRRGRAGEITDQGRVVQQAEPEPAPGSMPSDSWKRYGRDSSRS